MSQVESRLRMLDQAVVVAQDDPKQTVEGEIDVEDADWDVVVAQEDPFRTLQVESTLKM